ncbi:MAG TPA: sn-glycerol-1-phosphate dehydrogenase [Geminicoccaceae bacterium]|nr:sn-glycerol-1-phosphate dehydrogenase [Geminicoccaceae bacterium]
MAPDALAQLMAGRFRDPEDGAPLPAPVRTVVIEDSLAGREGELVAALNLGGRLAVVSDPTTRAVLGSRVEQALDRIAETLSIVLPEHPEPDLDTVDRLREAASGASALIAIGSGTINDLCKYAAAEAGLPFAVFATAPSMNGYTSINAAITVRGHKRSLAARLPAAVFFDLEILAAAPVRLIRAGLGDCLCRPTAQADWLLAHLLLGRPYRQAPFALLAADEAPLLAASAKLVAGDLDAIRRLVRTLALSGFGMTLCGGSEPASQGEHLISHYGDMLGDPAWARAFHGEQIGVATLTMARLQAEMLEGPPPQIEASQVDEASLIRHFGPELGHSCWQEFRNKRVDPGAAIQLNHRISERWDEIRTRIGAIHKPARELCAVLERAGAPTTPEALGWPGRFYQQAVRHARLIRNRYTFLDLAADAGRSDLLG